MDSLAAAADRARGLTAPETPRRARIRLRERIGQHAIDVAEQLILVGKGKDLRYQNKAVLVETLRHREPRSAGEVVSDARPQTQQDAAHRILRQRRRVGLAVGGEE